MEFDRKKYKVWSLPHPMPLHWVLNPGLVFNELVLGQRIPKVILVDKNSNGPLIERQYVPCPECGAINDARLWSSNNTFGHWFGYVCPECQGRIPCLWNVTSLVVLALTFPLWGFFKKTLEKKWYQKEIQRFPHVPARYVRRPRKIYWLKAGLIYGVVMFGIMVAPKILYGEVGLTQVLLQAAIWMCAGLLVGYFMGGKR